MADPTITNVDIGGVDFGQCSFRKETLNLSGAQTVALGTILARDSVSSKLVLFVPGGEASKSTSDGTFNLDPGDTLVINTNGAGNETSTWDATSATITDTTTYPVADQDGLTSIITITGGPYDGVAQTVTFSGTTTANTDVASQMNAQLDGCSVEVSGGQVKITTDGAGTGFDLAAAAGTGGLTWGSSTAGTGDVADIDNVTATEIKTVVEADTTDLTVTVVGDAAVFTATTSIQFVSGNALAKLGLSVETVTANENGIPKAVLNYELAGANGDNVIRALVAGEVRDSKLVIANGTSLTDAIRDQLRNYGIVPIDISELGQLDNQ
jgi:hypothetical protein